MMRKLVLFIASCILNSSAQAQIITTIAGGGTSGLGDGGPANNCELLQPYSTAVDAAGNIYIADAGNNRIRKVNNSGVIATVAGTGAGGYNGDNIEATNAELFGPVGIAVDASGNLFISDDYNNRIRKVNTFGTITTIAGTGTAGYTGDNGPATSAQLNGPHGIALDDSNNICIADYGNNSVRKINSATGIITTIGGINGVIGNTGDGGPATIAELYNPDGIAIDAFGNIYIGDISAHVVRKIDTSGIISRIAGTGIGGYSGDGGVATATKLFEPVGVAVDGTGNVYIGENNNYIRKVSSSGIISVVAGNGSGSFIGDGGPATLAGLNPVGITLDSHGNIYVSDFGNNRIRRIRNTVAVPEIQAKRNEMNIFPNPNNGHFTLQVLSAHDEAIPVMVTNKLGQKISSNNILANDPTDTKLDIPTGIYFLTITMPSGVYTEKLVINR
jgi:trimeric autotransporter adhesin